MADLPELGRFWMPSPGSGAATLVIAIPASSRPSGRGGGGTGLRHGIPGGPSPDFRFRGRGHGAEDHPGVSPVSGRGVGNPYVSAEAALSV